MGNARSIDNMGVGEGRPSPAAPAGRRPSGGVVGRVLAAATVLAAAVVSAAVPAHSHTPHDDVGDIALSPEFAEDGAGLAIVRSKVMRSTDGGRTWSETVRGLGDDTRKLARLAIAPSDPQIVYLTTRNDGLHKSMDGGASWRPVNGSLPSSSLSEVEVSPETADTALVAGADGGLFRTTDGGSSWVALEGFGRVTDVAFLPGGSRVLAGDGRGGLFGSDDAGATWAPLSMPRDGAVTTLATAAAGESVDVLFVGTSSGRLLRSDDGGESFSPVGDGLPDEKVMSVELSPGFADDSTVWASTRDSGVFRSNDAGATWAPMTDGLTTDEQADKVDVAHFRTVAAADDGSGDMALFVGGFDGLFTYDDEQGTWEPVETLAEYVTGLALSPDYADDGTLAVTTYVKGVFVSTDAASEWQFANDGLTVDDVGPGNKLAPLRRMHNVVFSPDYAADGTIFSANWVRVVKSTDRGASWQEVQVGEPPPDSPLRQFVLAVSPDYASDHTVFAATRQGEVFRSEDRGEDDTWQQVGSLQGRVRSLVVSPDYANDRVLYAGTVDGTFSSHDGGISWRASGPRTAQEGTGDETDAAVAVSVSPDYADDGTVFAGTDSGLFVTRDSGLSWTELTGSPLTESSQVQAVSVSPAYGDDGTVLVSTSENGVLRSTDGGTSFEQVGTELLEDDLLVADFINPTSAPIQFSPAFAEDRTVYAYAQTELVRSTDGGVSWEIIELPTSDEVLDSLGFVPSSGDFTAAGSSIDKRSFDTPIGTLSWRRVGASVAAGVIVFAALFAIGLRRIGRRRALLLAGGGAAVVVLVALNVLAG